MEHLTSCYWGGSSNPTERHDPSLPYLEQYRIDVEQFKGLFKQLFPWANGAQSDLLAVRFFRLLDQNCDGLINFREFINGLGRRNGGGGGSRASGAVIGGRCCICGMFFRRSVSRGSHREAEAPLQDARHAWWVCSRDTKENEMRQIC